MPSATQIPSAAAEFGAVAPAARLEDWQPGNSLHDAATALYDRYWLSGIGPAKLATTNHPVVRVLLP